MVIVVGASTSQIVSSSSSTHSEHTPFLTSVSSNGVPALICAMWCVSEYIFVEWKRFEKPCPLYILAISSVFLSIHLSVCLVPPHVISPSGQPPHQTSLQAVPRCHPSIWLCGMSQPFSREGCLTTIRLHPSLLLCFAAISPGPSLSKSTCLCYCLFGNEWVSMFNEMCFHTCGSYSFYNSSIVMQVPGCSIWKIGFAWAKVRY